MDGQVTQYLAIGGLVGFFVLVTAALVRHKMNIRRVWTQLAEKHGLELRLGPYPGVHGTLGGRTFEMGSDIGKKLLTRRADIKAVVEFYVRIGMLTPHPPGLIAGKRGFMDGAGPVQTGEAEFDKRCWVDCPDKEAAARWLTPVRRAAVRVIADAGGVFIGGGEGQPPLVGLTRTGYKVKFEWLEDLRARLTGAAEAIDRG
jgi:hypothetical protein